MVEEEYTYFKLVMNAFYSDDARAKLSVARRGAGYVAAGMTTPVR